MIPDLFQIGPLSIHSFGLMMVLCFAAAWQRLAISLRQAGERPELAERMVFWAALGGLLGARIFYVISFPSDFSAHPFQAIFGGAGFVFYGGFFGGVFAAWLVVRKEKHSFLWYADLTGPALAIGYAIGRIGCHLSGDGDYGKVSSLPWAVNYALGVVPTPYGVTVHPTPVYETLMALVVAALLLHVEKKKYLSGVGQRFGLYLILTAIARFLVEYLRVEPIVFMGHTQAQLESVGCFVVGGVLMLKRRSIGAIS